MRPAVTSFVQPIHQANDADNQHNTPEHYVETAHVRSFRARNMVHPRSATQVAKPTRAVAIENICPPNELPKDQPGDREIRCVRNFVYQDRSLSLTQS